MKLLHVIVASALLSTSASAAYLGATAGYLFDSEEEYLTASLGYTFSETEALRQGVELELGFTNTSESGGTVTLVPILANYRATLPQGEKLEFFLGAGAGMSRVDLDIPWARVNEADNAFTLQGFAGIGYRLGEATTFTVTARYLWVDDVSLRGVDLEVGDDVALSLGIAYRF